MFISFYANTFSAFPYIPLLHMLTYRSLTAFSAATFLACSAEAAGIRVTVNGIALPDAAVNQALAAGGGNLKAPATQAALNNLINQELLVQVARGKNLDQTDFVRANVEANFRRQMASAAFQAYLAKNPITGDDLHARYDDLLAQLPEKEFRIRHITVKTRPFALRVINALKEGEDFSNLATQSLDVQTADKGGELGWQNAQTILPVIFVQIRTLDPLQVTGPIRTPGGWDVVQLLETRPLKAPAFEVSKPQIQTQLTNEAFQRYIAELRGKAKIVAEANPNP